MDQEGLADEEVSDTPAVFSEHALLQYERIHSQRWLHFYLLGTVL